MSFAFLSVYTGTRSDVREEIARGVGSLINKLVGTDTNLDVDFREFVTTVSSRAETGEGTEVFCMLWLWLARGLLLRGKKFSGKISPCHVISSDMLLWFAYYVCVPLTAVRA